MTKQQFKSDFIKKMADSLDKDYLGKDKKGKTTFNNIREIGHKSL